MFQKKEVLFIGDYLSATGPAIVNKNLKAHLGDKVKFIYNRNKIIRTIQIVISLVQSKAVILSGVSRANLFVFKLKKITGNKVIYLMHGSVVKENKINGTSNPYAENLEKQHLTNSDSIICVSKRFMSWMQEQYPELTNKFNYVNNGIDWSLLKKDRSKDQQLERKKNYIMSIGGGMPRKNILKICEAIDLINKENSENLRLIVLGGQGNDLFEITKYPFVEYYGVVPYDQVFEYYSKSNLYIQNSSFETFGLAPIEALLSGCNLLLSKEVGALDLIENIDESDLIVDNQNEYEIRDKIINLLNNRNNDKLLRSLSEKNTSIEYQSNRLIDIIEKVMA